MKLGIISDTHDNLRAVRYFIEWFNESGAERVLHAGDFIAPFTIPALARFKGPVVGVFGNNDGDRDMLCSKAEGTSVELYSAPHRITLEGCETLLSHRPSDLPDTVPSEVDLVVNGHTHEPAVDRENGLTRINPGEAGGWLTETSRAMLYDTADDSVTVEMVPAP